MSNEGQNEQFIRPVNPELQFEELSMEDMYRSSDHLAMDGALTMEELDQYKRVYDLKDANLLESEKKQNTLRDTEKEYNNIARVLNKEKGEYRDETRARLEVRQGRNLSHILLNSRKLFGDSSEMRDVKLAVRMIEDKLITARDASVPMSIEELNQLENSYVSALDYCQHYIKVKTTHTGSARYEMVLAKMNQLMDEMGLIEELKSMAGKDQYADILKADCAYSALIGVRILRTAGRTITASSQTAGNGQDADVNEELAQDRTELFSKEELEAMDQPSVKIAKLLSLMEKPQNIVTRHGSDDYNLVVYLYNMLKGFPTGAHAEFFNSGTVGYKGKGYKRTYKNEDGKKVVAGTLIGLIQNTEGKLLLRVGNVEKEIPYSRDAIIGNISYNMLDGEKKFGQKCINDSMSWLKNEEDTTNLVVVRNTALKLINNRLGIKPTEFNNISTENVRQLAAQVMDGVYTHDEMVKLLASIESATESTSQMINGQETLELLHFRQGNLSTLKKKIVMPEPAPAKKVEAVKETAKKEQKWTEDEEEAKALLAEMVFSKDTWESDENLENKGYRMQKAISEHSYAFFLMVKDEKLVSGMVNKLPLPAESKTELIEQFGRMRVAALKDKEMAVALVGMLNKPLISAAVKTFAQSGVGKQSFVEMEEKIDEMIDGCSAKIQDQITDAVNKMFAPSEDEEDAENLGLYLDKRGLSETTKAEIIKDGALELEKILTESMSGDRGQGKFTKLVLKDYFKEVSTLDKRSMIASVIRDAKADTDGNLFESSEAQGTYLGAIFKGAGPLLQKMLQGMPLEGVPVNLRSAFDAVKSNLLPIPQEIVEAQLLSMVERSNGAVTRIEVEKALGAASVGQAFLCKIYGPSLSSDGKEVVIKLLRPDVRNRMMREKAFMLDCAQRTDTDGGMRKTYEGQLERIEEELDLTIEARNVGLGQIYNKSRKPNEETDSVSSMKLNTLIMPTTNSMVIEKSPGTTVDKYVTSLKEEIRTELEPLCVKNAQGEITLGRKGEYLIDINENNFLKAGKIRADLTKQLESAMKRQKHLVILAEKWVQEGLFGEGFYHGDLHAGNIMIDDDCATVIDFGNATQLSEEQKGYVTRMMSAAFIGDYKLFCAGYHALMHKDEATEAYYKSREAEFKKVIKEVLSFGDGNSTGQRIGVALIRAQELGLELPAAIFNFSQCQLRLQNTVEDLNKQIIGMQAALKQIDDYMEVDFVELDPYVALMKSIVENPSSAQLLLRDAKFGLVMGDKVDIMKMLGDVTPEGRAVFDANFLHEEYRDTYYSRLSPVIDECIAKQNADPGFNIREALQQSEVFKDYTKNNSQIGDSLLDAIDARVNEPQKLADEMEKIKNQEDVFGGLEQLRQAQDSLGDNPSEAQLANIERIKETVYKQFINVKRYALRNVTFEDVNHICGKSGMCVTNVFSKSIDIDFDEAKIEALVAKYEKDEMYGKELKDSYQKVTAMRARLKNTEKPDIALRKEATNLGLEFGTIISKCALNKVMKLMDAEIEGGEAVSYSTRDPKNFMDVMSAVLSENIQEMVSRLGIWGVSHAKQFNV